MHTTLIWCKNVPYALQFVSNLFREHEYFFSFFFYENYPPQTSAPNDTGERADVSSVGSIFNILIIVNYFCVPRLNLII